MSLVLRSCSDHAVAQADQLAPLPTGMGFEEVAALPLAATTALLCLDAADPVPGASVLLNGASGHPRRAPHRDRHLDRTHLPPPPQAGRPRPIDPHRVRDHHDHTSHTGCLTQPVIYGCSSPLR